MEKQNNYVLQARVTVDILLVVLGKDNMVKSIHEYQICS
jgi:hypothetical protein